jgi:hypothetical protein
LISALNEVDKEDHAFNALAKILKQDLSGKDEREHSLEELAEIVKKKLPGIDESMREYLTEKLADMERMDRETYESEHKAKTLEKLRGFTFESLIDALEDDDKRSGAAEILKDKDHQKLFNRFKKIIKGDDRAKKLGVIKTMSYMPGFRFKQELLSAARKDRDEDIRKIAQEEAKSKKVSKVLEQYSDILCKRCGKPLKIFDMSRGAVVMGGEMLTLYDAVVCSGCRSLECTSCKGHTLDAPCSWCGGQVSPAYKHLL